MRYPHGVIFVLGEIEARLDRARNLRRRSSRQGVMPPAGKVDRGPRGLNSLLSSRIVISNRRASCQFMYEGLLGLLQPHPPVSQRLVFMAIVAPSFRGIRTHPAQLRSLTGRERTRMSCSIKTLSSESLFPCRAVALSRSRAATHAQGSPAVRTNQSRNTSEY